MTGGPRKTLILGAIDKRPTVPASKTINDLATNMVEVSLKGFMCMDAGRW